VLGLLITLRDVLGGLAGLLDGLSRSFGRHDEVAKISAKLMMRSERGPAFI
jgi:hypothetical protein